MSDNEQVKKAVTKVLENHPYQHLMNAEAVANRVVEELSKPVELSPREKLAQILVNFDLLVTGTAKHSRTGYLHRADAIIGNGWVLESEVREDIRKELRGEEEPTEPPRCTRTWAMGSYPGQDIRRVLCGETEDHIMHDPNNPGMFRHRFRTI
jgi:hypothetical protein